MYLMYLIKIIIIDLIIIFFTMFLGYCVGWLIAKTLFPSVPLKKFSVAPTWINIIGTGITVIVGIIIWIIIFRALEINHILRTPIIFFVDIPMISFAFAGPILVEILHALYLKINLKHKPT